LNLNSGTYEATTYDTRNRVTQILLKNSSDSTLRTQSWTYDNNSNVATMTQAGVTTTYGYDDIDQLTSESRTGYSASYTYDANGNRLTRTIGGTTEDYIYDDADKLDKIEISSVTVKDYSYDSAGRTTSVVTGAGTTSLTYDYEGRITEIQYPNETTNTFAYNGLDTRVSKVDSGGTKTYLRDGAGVTAPVLNDGSASYTPGISERRSSATTFYHGGIKNAETQSNTSETVTATVTFDAFGNSDTSSGTWKGPFAYGGPFGYQSDSDSGLMLLGHRYYDSSTGRFLTRDPIKDGRNWYVYCDGNAMSRHDTEGLDWYYNHGTGELFHRKCGYRYGSDQEFPPGKPRGRGFSGRRGNARNNPDYVAIRNTGPIPKGGYTIGPPSGRTPGGRLIAGGCLPLTPDKGNNMHGRGGFLIHGGSEAGDPSQGCIILPKDVRDRIAKSKDNRLWVY
jgi:RHS repeat-associated protein